MATKRRPCAKCGRNRAEKFFVSARGRVCLTCQKKRTKFASREQRLAETYGITLDEYDNLLLDQGGACGICRGKRPYNLDIDHDHAYEKQLIAEGYGPIEARRKSIRGLLCKPCNRRLLPSAHDNIDILDNAAIYLTYSPAQDVLA